MQHRNAVKRAVELMRVHKIGPGTAAVRCGVLRARVVAEAERQGFEFSSDAAIDPDLL